MSADEHAERMAHESSRRAYDRMARREHRFAKPVTKDQLRDPLAQVDAAGWLGPSIRGWQVLCLAAGGGRQAPLYAAAGGHVTVVDISPEMLRLDRAVAREYNLQIDTVESSMNDLSMFPRSHFDLCIHPVSTCYVPSIASVFQQVASVVRPGGLYVSQHKTPTSLQASVPASTLGYQIDYPYYMSEALPPVHGSLHREEGTLEFLHRWEEILGGMCRNGFVIEDVAEPFHGDRDAVAGTFAHRSQYIAPYVRIKARRTASSPAQRHAKLELPT